LSAAELAAISEWIGNGALDDWVSISLMSQASRSLVLLLLAPLLLAACDSSAEEGADSETGGEVSHDADIQPIWDANCVENCHSPGGLAEFLDLSDAYPTLIDQASAQATGSLVEPGSSADSYLVAKLRGTQVDAGGNGGQMPSGGNAPLDEATISTIEAWIDAGAPE
jgi:hypothetical protein